ncbi:DNA-binding transcriptional regulator, LysR family [Rhizobiales bacterium GAS191]|nr:DNA-binding transcriptional regulator, LysR family [Rhizobiales bacterium GAS191]
MFAMNWGAFDLNLLIVFDAVMQERSVTRAGSRIGLSQPAMSHALNRLRHMLKDELFVRTPEGMVPTPRAEMLAQPLRNALSEMQLAFEPATFAPATSDRSFALAVNNYAAVVLAPPLVAAVSAAAPAVRLDLRPSGTLDVLERLDRGDLDLTLGNMESSGERFAMAPLLEDQFVMVMRRGHPASRGKPSAAAFAALPHLEISSSREDTGFIDRWLGEFGLERRVTLRAPYFPPRRSLSNPIWSRLSPAGSLRSSCATIRCSSASRHMIRRAYKRSWCGTAGWTAILPIAGCATSSCRS